MTTLTQTAESFHTTGVCLSETATAETARESPKRARATSVVSFAIILENAFTLGQAKANCARTVRRNQIKLITVVWETERGVLRQRERAPKQRERAEREKARGELFLQLEPQITGQFVAELPVRRLCNSGITVNHDNPRRKSVCGCLSVSVWVAASVASVLCVCLMIKL